MLLYNKVVSKSSKLYEWILFVIYKTVLDVIYVSIQCKLFGYYGFSYDYNLMRLIIGWILYLLSVYILKRDQSELGDLFIYVIMLLSVTPCIVYYEFNESCDLWMIASQTIGLYFISILLSLSSRFSIKAGFRKISYKNKTFRMLITVFMAAFLGYLLVTHGLPTLSSITFANISAVRAASNSSTALTIVWNLVCKIICPCYMLIALNEKKYIAFSFGLLIAVYSYAITGFKTFLFIPAVMIGVAFLRKLNLRECILMGLPLAVSVVGILYTATKNVMLYALINERVVFLPAKIKIAYFDYFSKNSFVYFSQSTIAQILGISSNYNENIPNLIGRVYFNRPGMWTNAGFMADAYSNLGFVGMVLINLILVWIIKVAEKQMKSLNFQMKKSIEVLFIIYFISLNDGGAISVIFSGGMIFILLMMAIINFSESKMAVE